MVKQLLKSENKFQQFSKHQRKLPNTNLEIEILFIASKDKEKKSHLPCAQHEFAVFVKKKSQV